METKIIEKSTLRGTLTFGQGTQPIQGAPQGRVQQANIYPDLTLLSPSSLLSQLFIANTSKSQRSRELRVQGVNPGTKERYEGEKQVLRRFISIDNTSTLSSDICRVFTLCQALFLVTGNTQMHSTESLL